MGPVQPWTTCLLTTMLIQYLESEYPQVCSSLDYDQVLRAGDFAYDVPDPRAFLMDDNNWIPHPVLRELMQQCVRITENPDFPYLAALAYYRSTRTRRPSLMETIALFLHDVDQILRAASEWASGYFNYLQFQAFSRPGESQSLYILSRYQPWLDPGFANIRLLQGNIEGIASLDPTVESVASDVLYSQVKLSAVVAEHGAAYALDQRDGHALIKERRTGKVVVEAAPVQLLPQRVPFHPRSPSPRAESSNGLIVLPDATGSLSVHFPPSDKDQRNGATDEGTQPITALRVEQGGKLGHGKLALTIPEGALFEAPYSLFRVRWHTSGQAKATAAIEKEQQAADEKQRFASLLFGHLKALQTTQLRTLSMMIRNVELTEENIRLKQELSGQQERGGLIGKSVALQEVLSLARTVAASDTTVLITGETGTGKELVARLIHHLSPRHPHRFIAVNCGAVPETLLESDLFGHEKGAFTGAVSLKKGKFELAQGGTIFLDEIGDLSPAVQVKLLRVLQEKEFQRVGGTADLKADVRIIAATNRDLEALIERNRFRNDLYYRLNVIQLYMPPLRERRDDIPVLAHHFIRRFGRRAGKSIKGLTSEALHLCFAYKWPGNIRELENVIERATTLAPEDTRWITPELLPPGIRQTGGGEVLTMDVMEYVNRIEWSAVLMALRTSGSLSDLLHQVEWAITRRTVSEYGGNKSRAAKVLGRTYRWLRKLETEMDEPKASPPPPDSPH